MIIYSGLGIQFRHFSPSSVIHNTCTEKQNEKSSLSLQSLQENALRHETCQTEGTACEGE